MAFWYPPKKHGLGPALPGGHHPDYYVTAGQFQHHPEIQEHPPAVGRQLVDVPGPHLVGTPGLQLGHRMGGPGSLRATLDGLSSCGPACGVLWEPGEGIPGDPSRFVTNDMLCVKARFLSLKHQC
jgi:hypothetical protein